MNRNPVVFHLSSLLLLVGMLLVPAFSTSVVPDTGYVADYSTPSSNAALTSTTAINPASQQWYLVQTGTPQAWKIVQGGQGISVAVLDTGIDDTVGELSGKVSARNNFSLSKEIDTVHGHGTYVAGIIAADADENGITGVAYNSTLLDVQVANNDGSSNAQMVAEGIIWAVDNGANVINISVVINKPYPMLEFAANYAWTHGCLIIAAAGNNFSSNPVYPASYPHVIAVAATDKDDNLARWSNYGDWVSVGAPGVDIYGVLPDGQYAVKSGSSYSTALVSGEAALLFAAAFDVNGNGQINDEVYDAILNNGDNLATPALPGQRVNVYKAVESTAIISEMLKK